MYSVLLSVSLTACSAMQHATLTPFVKPGLEGSQQEQAYIVDNAQCKAQAYQQFPLAEIPPDQTINIKVQGERKPGEPLDPLFDDGTHGYGMERPGQTTRRFEQNRELFEYRSARDEFYLGCMIGKDWQPRATGH